MTAGFTDGQGHRRFRNTLIVMTPSGLRASGRPAGSQDIEAAHQVMASCAGFRPVLTASTRSLSSSAAEIEMAPSSISSSWRLARLLEERKIASIFGARLARREGLGPGLW
jgi:hypothetical protein